MATFGELKGQECTAKTGTGNNHMSCHAEKIGKSVWLTYFSFSAGSESRSIIVAKYSCRLVTFRNTIKIREDDKAFSQIPADHLCILAGT